MVITNLFFAMLVMGSVVPRVANSIIFWGMNIGVLGFAVGLILENDVLKRIFTPILGLALLYGIFTYLMAKPAPSQMETAAM
jgi:predicted membrane protein